MKSSREEQPEFEKPSRVYTSDTDQALLAEIRRGACPYKLARYFDVDIRIVLRMEKRQKTINAIFKKRKEQEDAD